MHSHISCLIGFILLVFTGCTDGRSVDSDSSNLSVDKQELSGITNSQGRVSFDFSLPPSSRSFQLLLSFSEGQARLLAIENSRNDSLLGTSSFPYLQGNSLVSSPLSVNVPYQSSSLNGNDFTAVYEVRDSKDQRGLSQIPVELDILSKPDLDLSHGTLRVNILLVGPVVDSIETEEALDRAFETFKLIFNRAGITVDPQWYEFSGPSTVPDPRSGSSFYRDLSLSTRSNAVNIVIASQVSGVGNRENEFGLAASPGPALPSPKSAIALSILRIAGGDGKFDYEETGSREVHNDETRLLAEEMARLTSKYIGLEDTMKFNGDRASGSDSLSDTASCLALTECRLERQVRNNLMFPFPLRKVDQFEEYFPRDNFSDQQRSVVNNSVLVD